MVHGIMYLQYWLNLAIVQGSFLLHLNVIKSNFCDVHRIVDRSHNAKGAMAEHLELNPMTRLWMKINSSSNLSEKLSEYNKLAKIVMV